MFKALFISKSLLTLGCLFTCGLALNDDIVKAAEAESKLSEAEGENKSLEITLGHIWLDSRLPPDGILIVQDPCTIYSGIPRDYGEGATVMRTGTRIRLVGFLNIKGTPEDPKLKVFAKVQKPDSDDPEAAHYIRVRYVRAALNG